MDKFKEVSFDGVNYIAPNWEEMGQLIFDLSKEIIESKSSKVDYDWVIAIAKGGWTWARTLVDYLGIDNLSSIQLQFYSGIGKTEDKPLLKQPLQVEVSDCKVLVFDDVADGGHTLLEAVKHIKNKGAKEVETATLFYKPRSVIKPDFFASQTSSWIVFPHEIREFIFQAGGEWMKKGLKREEIIDRFNKLNLPKNQVEFFIGKLF
jgi:uncharacterized protein